MINYLFHYTFPELLQARETVNDEHGLIWAGDVRKYDMQQPGYDVRLWKAWQQSFKTRKEVPPKAMAYFQETKHLTRPPKEGDKNILQNGPISEALIVKDEVIKPFSWSHSAISDFDTCPYQYAHKRIYKTIPYEETEATIWGTRVHKVAEDLLNGVEVNDPEAEALVRPYVNSILASRPDFLGVELQMGLTEDWKACGFKEGYGRIISDVFIKKGNKITVLDWKTGKRRDKKGNPKTISNDQLIINCIAAAIHYPEVQHFNAKYIYVSEPDPAFKTPGIEPLERKDLLPHLKNLTEKIKRMKEAILYENYPYSPSGLCRGWCKIPECPHKRG